ncbi:hypothetical protein [uncultured Thiobacillus sp.]|uniref:hypothetical protein n=1 Tax=uncultured Thiobacillus sp. TaxID=189996 RepID=UPI002611CE98|nr:hypothetical protein [uncultured Thiobacillus sp.]
MHTLQRTEVDRFLASGHYDNGFETWPGDTFVERATCGSAALRSALISEVLQRTGRAAVPAFLENADLKLFAHAKLAPMVQGLFPQRERMTVLERLERSIVFLTPATIANILEKTPWLTTAWDLANLYLASFDAKRLSDDAPDIVGLSEETTCYVSVEYFDVNNRFDDYVVHEAAHIFHNCKRETLGLNATRHREWLLEIDFAKRETFAYACEAYSRILELGETRSTRNRLLSELADGAMPPDERVHGAEYVDILRAAVAARNGWKSIRERCSRSNRPAESKRLRSSISPDPAHDAESSFSQLRTIASIASDSHHT